MKVTWHNAESELSNSGYTQQQAVVVDQSHHFVIMGPSYSTLKLLDYTFDESHASAVILGYLVYTRRLRCHIS
jgi:hypothetical protein